MIDSRASFALSVLGPFGLTGPAGPLRLPNKKLAALLAFLACTQPIPQSRDRLAAVLWGTHFQKQARQNLRQALVRLRQVLGSETLVAEADSLALAEATVNCDAVQFASLLRLADEESLAAAIELYRGPLLDDVVVHEAAWTEWITVERRRYEEQAIDAMVALGEMDIAAGRYERARRLARRALEINRFQEEASRLLINALVRSGRRADALSYFADFKQQLRDELGTAPDRPTLDLIARLRENSPSHADGKRDSWAPRSPGPEAIVSQAANDSQTCMAIVMPKELHGSAQHFETILSAYGQGSAETSEIRGRRYWSLTLPSPVEAAQLGFSLKRIGSGKPIVRDADDMLAIGADLVSCRSKRPFAGPQALAELSEDGRFLATEDVCEKLVDGVDATLFDLGLVNVPHAAASFRAFELRPVGEPPAKPKAQLRMRPLIAVLPFDERPSHVGVSIRGELFAEEMINLLSTSRHVDVVSRISSRHLAGRKYDARVILSSLDVDYLIAGTISSEGRAFEVCTELIEAPSGIVRWRSVRSASMAQPPEFRDLSLSIVSELGSVIFIQEAERALTQPLDSLISYSLLFAGLSLMDRWTRTSFGKAGDILQHLQSRMPTHPLSNAWLSAWHTRSISQGWTNNTALDGARALEFAANSLETDPNCSIALTMDGWANVYVRKDLDVASRQLEMAIAVNSSDALAWLLKGVVHAFRGEGQQASLASHRALQLSPLDPRRSYYLSMASTAEIAAANFDTAVEYANASLRLNRLHASTLRALAIAQWQSGRRRDARETVSKLLALNPDFTIADYQRNHPSMQSEFGQNNAAILGKAGVPS